MTIFIKTSTLIIYNSPPRQERNIVLSYLVIVQARLRNRRRSQKEEDTRVARAALCVGFEGHQELRSRSTRMRTTRTDMPGPADMKMRKS